MRVPVRNRRHEALPRVIDGVLVGMLGGAILAYGGSDGNEAVPGRYLFLVLAVSVLYFVVGCIPVVRLFSYIRPLWEERKRTLHDSMAKTIVIRVR